jgi:hypothetical protein
MAILRTCPQSLKTLKNWHVGTFKGNGACSYNLMGEKFVIDFRWNGYILEAEQKRAWKVRKHQPDPDQSNRSERLKRLC